VQRKIISGDPILIRSPQKRRKKKVLKSILNWLWRTHLTLE